MAIKLAGNHLFVFDPRVRCSQQGTETTQITHNTLAQAGTRSLSMQQTLQQQQQQGRFTSASKLLVNQGGGAGPAAMMAGRMMGGVGVGGMTGQSLSSGLEDLKKTAGGRS